MTETREWESEEKCHCCLIYLYIIRQLSFNTNSSLSDDTRVVTFHVTITDYINVYYIVFVQYIAAVEHKILQNFGGYSIIFSNQKLVWFSHVRMMSSLMKRRNDVSNNRTNCYMTFIFPVRTLVIVGLACSTSSKRLVISSIDCLNFFCSGQ